MHPVIAFIILALAVTCIGQCPNGWKQSPIDHDTCYLVMVSKKTWFDAESYCQAAAPSAHLTSIASAFEASSLNGIVTGTPSISSCDQLWIGANDFDHNGNFVWSNGNAFQYTKWGSGQPDLSNQCVSSQTRTTGLWKTEPCTTENCFICEQQNNQGTSTRPPTTTIATTTTLVGPVADCYDWMHIHGATKSGIYLLSPLGTAPFGAYCDMDTNGGGWTVFQKRQDHRLNFWDRGWNDYKHGFNNGLDQNSWLGLDRIHILSSKDHSVTLRVDLYGNRCTDLGDCVKPADGHWFGEWQGFKIDNENDNYKFHITSFVASNYTTSQDDIMGLNGAYFSTADHHINNNNGGCEQNNEYFLGPWWNAPVYGGCYNGKYVDIVESSDFYGFAVYDRKSSGIIFPVQSQIKLRKSG